MSWRVVVVTGSAKVDFKMNYLVIRTVDSTKRIHIDEIGVLLLENTAISITAYALSELISHKAKVIFCDRTRNPVAELIPCYGSHDSTKKIRQQIAWKPEIRRAVWTEIVREKIRGQRAFLQKEGLPEAGTLTRYLEELQPGDETNREGHAAKVYFAALFGPKFYRDLPCPVNSALNYGYGLILSAVNREISTAGYLTQLGIFHDNGFNAFNLGCDFMEPLRPMIDHAVVRMTLSDFGKEGKRKLIRLLNEEVRYDGSKHVLLYAIRLYCAGIFRALQGENLNQLKWIHYDLS